MAIGELIALYPRLSIIILAFLVSLFITIVNYYMIDKTKMKAIRDRQKDLRKEMKTCKDNPERMLEINQQMLADLPEQMKMSFKPMLITMIPLLILFAWLRSTFTGTAISGSWLWWYIGSSLIFSITIRKLFGLQ
jgi:uncharacterized membrane protein (DUF106 family)